MFLAEVAVLLGASFLGDSGRRLSSRSLVSSRALLGSFLVGLCIRLFLCTYALYSFKRHKKQMHVYRSHTFLVKVEMVLPNVWAHPKNVTHQNSLGKQYVHGNCTGLGAWAVEPAGQLRNVGVELFYRLNKLNTDALGFLEHVRDVIPLLLSCYVGKHSAKVEHDTVIERLPKNPLGSFLEKPCRSM